MKDWRRIEMLLDKTLQLYFDYVKGYNLDPTSEESDKNYELFADNVFDKFDSKTGEEVLDNLCSVDDDNKLDAQENLRILKEKLNSN